MEEQIAGTDGVTVTEVTITLPLADTEFGYCSPICDMRNLTAEQRTFLRRLENGFKAQQAKLNNGKLIRSRTDAAKRLLELGAGAESPPPKPRAKPKRQSSKPKPNTTTPPSLASDFPNRAN